MKPGAAGAPDDDLAVIRLHPPERDFYFIELIGLPRPDQRDAKRWERVELNGTRCDGWYVVPCFRYMALFGSDVRNSTTPIAYASPALMALANLLSHPTIGTATIANTDDLRSAKDLGRVLSLARLASAEELEGWPTIWWSALQKHFGHEAQALATRAGAGLRALLGDGYALGQAFDLATNGLLAGRGVGRDNFEIVAQQLISITVAELRELAGIAG